MKQFYLAEITTSDGLVHQGIFAPAKRRNRKAILWVHGLTGRFYGDTRLMEELTNACETHGFGFASFNTRGHDMVTGIHKVDPSKQSGYSKVTVGAGYETFTDCVYDIDAGIRFLHNYGYTQVFIAGISTGANKACYYATQTGHTPAAGVILLSPISDRLSPHGKRPWFVVAGLKFLTKIGLGNRLMNGPEFFPGTPNRFLSLITPGSPEDVFNYGDPIGALAEFSTITVPTMVAFGDNDEYADRPVPKIRSVFDRVHISESYKSMVLYDTGHGFDGKERRLAREITTWISRV